jgi:hypothetical protein
MSVNLTGLLIHEWLTPRVRVNYVLNWALFMAAFWCSYLAS